MWICRNCNTDIEDDSFESCWNCDEPRIRSTSGWICEKCNSQVETDDMFCSNCGEPKNKENQIAPQPSSTICDMEKNAVMAAPTPAQANISIEPAMQTRTPSVYDASVFASQFPQWDLMPPAVLVRRLRRSI